MEADVTAELIALRLVLGRLLLAHAERDPSPSLWLKTGLEKTLSFVDGGVSTEPPSRGEEVRTLIKEVLRETYGLASSAFEKPRPPRV